MQKYRAAFFPQKLQGKLKNTSKSDLKLKIPDVLYNQTVLTSMAFQMPVGVLTACTTHLAAELHLSLTLKGQLILKMNSYITPC